MTHTPSNKPGPSLSSYSKPSPTTIPATANAQTFVHKSVSLPTLPLLTNGTIAVDPPPAPPVGGTKYEIPVPVATMTLAFPGTNGNGSGCAEGMTVVFPTTNTGAEGVRAPDVKVAVTVVEEITSVRVTVLPGEAVLVVSELDGARVMEAASGTLL